LFAASDPGFLTSAIRYLEVVHARGFPFIIFIPQGADDLWFFSYFSFEHASRRMRRQFVKHHNLHAHAHPDSNADADARTFLSIHAGGAHHLDGQHQQPACAHSGKSVDRRVGNWVE
jgi:hypothetical protein